MKRLISVLMILTLAVPTIYAKPVARKRTIASAKKNVFRTKAFNFNMHRQSMTTSRKLDLRTNTLIYRFNGDKTNGRGPKLGIYGSNKLIYSGRVNSIELWINLPESMASSSMARQLDLAILSSCHGDVHRVGTDNYFLSIGLRSDIDIKIENSRCSITLDLTKPSQRDLLLSFMFSQSN